MGAAATSAEDTISSPNRDGDRGFVMIVAFVRRATVGIEEGRGAGASGDSGRIYFRAGEPNRPP